MKYKFAFIYCLSFLLLSCSKDELSTKEMSFIHIMAGESSVATVSSQSNSIGTYHVYLSSRTADFRDSVLVTYNITVGNGLTEGVDFELINKGNTLTFLSGIYDMPIRIKWIANPVDKEKDNTIKIDLVSTSRKEYTLGLPGPSQNQKSFTITKIP